ncbi:MAG TPA: hypothetical protein VGH73_10700 [Thermoanaerobaculia bacterium]
MKSLYRLVFVLAVAALAGAGMASTPTPALATTCPVASCANVISACNQLGGVQGAHQVGTCTAADGTTHQVWFFNCPGVPFSGTCTR